jgi:heterodisulfide reductase subunit A-like polyferredoxin
MTRLYIMGGVALAIVAAIFFVYVFITDLQATNAALVADNTILQTNVTTLEIAIVTQSAAISDLKSDFARIAELQTETYDKLETARDTVNRLTTKLDAHSLGALAAKKPTIIEKIVNKASNAAARCIEILSGSPLTSQEITATVKSDFNSECPEIANPNYRTSNGN